MMMAGLSLLVHHFITDYSFKNEFATPGAGRGGGPSSSSAPFLSLTLPLQMMQKPFYEFLKAAFTYLPIESTVAFSQAGPPPFLPLFFFAILFS